MNYRYPQWNDRLATGEISTITANLTGNIKPSDIPIAPGVDLIALKGNDLEPMEVVVEIPPGESTRGWEYQPESLQAIVKYVQEKTLNGFLGHQKPEEIEREFKTPVTHWIGAIWLNGKAYFRGIIDSAASDLKRWIKAGRIKQVSIFGVPKLVKSGGKTMVVDYTPLSIDWTPLDRAGMQTSIVSVGEINTSTGNSMLRTKRVPI